MPKHPSIKKVLVIGSGPIVIGQAAEFDYAGTQACRALKEEGLEVVLVNSNPATIMTDAHIADHVYIEPLTAGTIERIIEKERPDSILPTLGGQTGLNLAMELVESGCLARFSVSLLGTNEHTIKMAEDRLAFKDRMSSIGESCVLSEVVSHVEDALKFAEESGLPVVVRPAFTLGGSGGGIAHSYQQLKEIVRYGLRVSRANQVLIERCISGWKEIEYEVIRDNTGDAVSVCHMENVDPVGVHTGDSIVVAPSQTLSEKELATLRKSSLKIIDSLNIEGGCNVQFAVNPTDASYAVIEVNPRVSRSSALASKATGYPIAKVSTKIAIGYRLSEIFNNITQESYSGYEPYMEHVVVKMPTWPFDKFTGADRTLGTQMKATGEIMAVGSTFESALMKAIRSLELGLDTIEQGIYKEYDAARLRRKIKQVDDERIFAVAESFRRGFNISEVEKVTCIDEFFLHKIKKLVDFEQTLKKEKVTDLPKDNLLQAKRLGFSDKGIASLLNVPVRVLTEERKKQSILSGFMEVKTSTAGDGRSSSYYYSSYDVSPERKAHDPKEEKEKVLVIGSGPIRIGQGIEFDYCTVHSVWALQKLGFEVIVINNNPETVSTDFDTADYLYFEPLTAEDIENIVQKEKPVGAVVQFGGQTAIKVVKSLVAMGVEILGTGDASIDMAEDRQKFDELLHQLNLPRPQGKTVHTHQEGIEAANMLSYPVLVRPSYVLGGQGMEIAYQQEDMERLLSVLFSTKQEYPVLIDKYLKGIELEVDAISDGDYVLVPGIMEHLERAGIHSGDSISVYPPYSISEKTKKKVVEYTESLARALKIRGLINIQYVLYDDELYVIEVNPRSSRTVPYISKVTGVPIVELATKIMAGKGLNKEEVKNFQALADKSHTAVKVPVFSFEKLSGVDISLGPEMKSTGEVLGIGKNFSEALLKGMVAAGMVLPKPKSGILMTVRDTDKEELSILAKDFADLDFSLWATSKTADFLAGEGIKVTSVKKIGEGEPDILDVIESGEISLVVNTPTRGKKPERDGFKIRRKSVEMAIPCLTSLDTAHALTQMLKKSMNEENVALLKLSPAGGFSE